MADDVLGPVAEQPAEGLVDLDDPALAMDGDRLVGRVGQSPEALLALAQGGLRRDPLANLALGGVV